MATTTPASETLGCAAVRDARGMSLVELLVALALMSVVGLIFFQLFTGMLSTTVKLESHADLGVLGQRSVNLMRQELMQSRTVFESDAVGQSYLTAMTLSPSFPVLTDTKLPAVVASGLIEEEGGGDNLVGNSLLLVRQHVPIEVSVDHDADVSTANIDFLADTYTFQYYYLTQRSIRDFNGTGGYLDLVRAESQPYADYFQLSGLSVAVRAQLQAGLIAEGISVAWDPGTAANAAFYSMGSGGTLTAASAHRPDMTDVVSLVPEFVGGRISGDQVYSVATAGSVVSSGYLPVHKLAYPNGQFPSGFEVMVAGPSGSRKVFLRLVLMSDHLGKITGQANEMVVANADF